VMVTSACKVERYRTPSDGFWNLYLTWLNVEGMVVKTTSHEKKRQSQKLNGVKVRELKRVLLTGIERKADDQT
jgi:hypothetical protein